MRSDPWWAVIVYALQVAYLVLAMAAAAKLAEALR